MHRNGLFRTTLGVLACVASAGVTLRAQSPLLHLDLNLPAYRLDVFLRHERVRSYHVAIGTRDTRTPRGAFGISLLLWNPVRVPRGSQCTGNGRVTPRSSKGPTARVRLLLTPLLFIQGTTEEGLLETPSARRSLMLASSDAIDFATLIQRTELGPRPSDSLLAIVLPGVRSIAVKLHERIPIVIRYEPLDVVGDTLFVYPDPYGLGTSPWKDARRALARAGLDTMAIDVERLRRMLRYPDRTSASLLIRRSAETGR